LDESLTQPPSDKSNVNEWAANIINKAVKKSESRATEIVNKVKEEDLRQFMFCVLCHNGYLAFHSTTGSPDPIDTGVAPLVFSKNDGTKLIQLMESFFKTALKHKFEKKGTAEIFKVIYLLND